MLHNFWGALLGSGPVANCPLSPPLHTYKVILLNLYIYCCIIIISIIIIIVITSIIDVFIFVIIIVLHRIIFYFTGDRSTRVSCRPIHAAQRGRCCISCTVDFVSKWRHRMVTQMLTLAKIFMIRMTRKTKLATLNVIYALIQQGMLLSASVATCFGKSSLLYYQTRLPLVKVYSNTRNCKYCISLKLNTYRRILI